MVSAQNTVQPPLEPDNPSGQSKFHGSTEVVASRIVDDASAAGRREVILTRAEIRGLPVETLQDVLALLPGLGLVRRGARGVQADLNLRGSTFEQTAVLVNGVRVNNPQTGHHNLDLFIPAAAISRVEVLFGPGSAVHGPDAFGGAINIVTGVNETSGYVRMGSHHLTGGGLAGPLGSGGWAAAEREVHTGFRDDTEAWVNQAAGGWNWSDAGSSLAITVAAGERRFGAWSFYSQRFPNQREATGGELFTLRSVTPVAGAELAVAMRLDGHRDEFILDRNRPDWYRNVHHTRGALLGFSLASEVRGWRWVVGMEGARDEIDSSNLGRHHRSRSAAFAELGWTDGGPVTGGIQLRWDHQDPWGTVAMVGAGGTWHLGRRLRLSLAHGQSFRAPSFTDLYYSSPVTSGNPELRPERGHTSEIGVTTGPFTLTLFSRAADPIIDYVLDDDEVWQASNAGRVTTRGAEAALFLPRRGRLQWQRLGLVYLDSAVHVDPTRSAYALAHPEIEAVFSGALAAIHGWRAGWALRWRQPTKGGSWSTVDFRLDRPLPWNLTMAIEANNLFDRQISELHGIPLPGRWLTLTLAYSGSPTASGDQ